MKSSIYVLLSFAVLIIFSCSSTPKGNYDAELKALRQIDNDWSMVCATKDADRYMAFYDKDATVIDFNGQVTKDMDVVKKSVKEEFALPGISISFHNENASVAECGDIGYTTGTWDMQWNGDKGEQMKAHGPYLVIWKKQIDGTWKAIVDSYWKVQ
jgi:ketosteroid isomerase-like protein